MQPVEKKSNSSRFFVEIGIRDYILVVTNSWGTMATSEAGTTADKDFSQEIVNGKALPEDELWDVLTSNLRQVMESTGAAMRIVDLDFNVVVENQLMKDLGGVEAESSETLKCFDQFCNPEVCGTGNCTLKQVVDEGQDEIRVEVEKESYDGQIIPTELVVRPIYDSAGDIVAISETFRDISDRKSATRSIKSAVDEVKVSSEEIAENSQDISDQAMQQLESITNVSQEVSSLSATVEEIAATADEVESISEQARTQAETGEEKAEETVEMMDDIETAADEVTSDIRALNESTQEIDELVDVINDIADQTNLLALNASIEAARAGEAGDGFAVVADEVKSLANDSQERAAEIEAIVADVRAQTSEAVDNLEATNDVVQDGAAKVQRSSETFKSIANVVEEASDGITEVADATDDQAISTEQIASLVDETAEDFERVTDEAESIATANEELTSRIQEVSREVDELNSLDVQSQL